MKSKRKRSGIDAKLHRSETENPPPSKLPYKPLGWSYGVSQEGGRLGRGAGVGREVVLRNNVCGIHHYKNDTKGSEVPPKSFTHETLYLMGHSVLQSIHLMRFLVACQIFYSASCLRR